jgi:hypothetical protein
MRSQPIESFKFSQINVYLPSGGLWSEEFVKENHITMRNTVYRENWQKEAECKSTLLTDEAIQRSINVLDSLMKLNQILIAFDSSLIKLMKDYRIGVYPMDVSIEKIDLFFKNKDFITLDLLNLPEFPKPPIILDGIPFEVKLNFKRLYADTISYELVGNLYGQIEPSNIRNWLVFYLTFKDNPVFSSEYLKNEYFSKERLAEVLLRFVAAARD